MRKQFNGVTHFDGEIRRITIIKEFDEDDGSHLSIIFGDDELMDGWTDCESLHFLESATLYRDIEHYNQAIRCESIGTNGFAWIVAYLDADSFIEGWNLYDLDGRDNNADI